MEGGGPDPASGAQANGSGFWASASAVMTHSSSEGAGAATGLARSTASRARAGPFWASSMMSGRDDGAARWALRGGGGNFGVVTSFLFRTHPVAMVYGGPIVFELSDAATAMKWFRDNQPKAPDEFFIFLGLQAIPPSDPFPREHWSKKMCVIVVSHSGPIAEGEKAVNAVRAALPKPIIDWAQPMPYTVIQTLFDPLLPKGLQWYWKGDFVKELPDAAIDAHLAYAAKLPSALSVMHLYPIEAPSIGTRRTQPPGVVEMRSGRW